jgi:hypothetical protein
MSTKHFAALLGFAFVAAWIGFGFGEALLCLLGAGAFYGVVLVLEGQVDLGDLQDRLRSRPPTPAAVPPATPPWPAPRPSRRVR